MSVENVRKWFMIHTYSGYEKKVKTDLEQKMETLGFREVVTNILVPEEELTEIVIPLETDWIDLQPAVEDHILLSIPLQVLSPEELSEDRMPSGQDWEVISQDELSLRRTVAKEQQIDPRLAALQSFFDSDETEK